MFKVSTLHSARRVLARSYLPSTTRQVLPILTRAYATGGSKENVSFYPAFNLTSLFKLYELKIIMTRLQPV